MQTMTPSDNSRPSVGAHYNIKRATIIKTRESIQMGATFINYTLVTNLDACLVECWITDNCDTAIYQESPVDFSNHLPYLINMNNNNNNINNNKNKQPQISHNILPGSGQSLSLSNLLAVGDTITTTTTENTSGGDDDEDVDSDEDDDEDNEIDADKENLNDDDDNKISNTFWMKPKRSKMVKRQANFSPEDSDDDDEAEIESTLTNDDDDANVNDDADDNVNLIAGQRTSSSKIPETGFYICYLFQCAKQDGFKCQFSNHNYYVSSMAGKQPDQKLPHSSSFITPIGTQEKQKEASPNANNKEIGRFSSTLSGEEVELQVDNSRPLVTIDEPRYSNMINGHHRFTSNIRHPFSHVASSIRIGQEEVSVHTV